MARIHGRTVQKTLNDLNNHNDVITHLEPDFLGCEVKWAIGSITKNNRNQIDYILCSQRCRSSIQSAKTRLRADCGSDHELLIVKFRLKLKKVGKTTSPFRYDLNQIPYDYTVEVTNRLDLIECLKNYGQKFITLCRRQ